MMRLHGFAAAAGSRATFQRAQIAEADLEHVEIERGIEIVAVGPLAGEVVDPGDDAAVIVDVVVERHGDQRLVGAAADLVAGIEIEQRLIEDRIVEPAWVAAENEQAVVSQSGT